VPADGDGEGLCLVAGVLDIERDVVAGAIRGAAFLVIEHLGGRDIYRRTERAATAGLYGFIAQLLDWATMFVLELYVRC